MPNVTAELLFQGTGATANPVVQIYQVPAGKCLYITSLAMSYLSTVSAGAAPAYVQVSLNASVANGGPVIAAMHVGLGDKSVNTPRDYGEPIFVGPGNFVVLYMSGIPATTDYFNVSLNGYTQ